MGESQSWEPVPAILYNMKSKGEKDMPIYVDLDEVINFVKSVLPDILGEKLGETLSTCPSAKVPELIYGRRFTPDEEKCLMILKRRWGSGCLHGRKHI